MREGSDRRKGLCGALTAAAFLLAPGAAVARLAEVKTAWDPDNVLRTNRNIAPVHGSRP